jgi:hypothetical protein
MWFGHFETIYASMQINFKYFKIEIMVMTFTLGVLDFSTTKTPFGLKAISLVRILCHDVWETSSWNL